MSLTAQVLSLEILTDLQQIDMQWTPQLKCTKSVWQIIVI